jgi:hypothetical protein
LGKSIGTGAFIAFIDKAIRRIIMETKFSPNNPKASKYLFTGRTKDLKKIINFIQSENCVGVFGERKSGKTLTLEILDAIISGEIEKFEDKLIDEKLAETIPEWKHQFADYKSIFISLFGTRNEEELVNEFVNNIKDRFPTFLEQADNQRNGYTIRLNDLLNKIHKIFSKNNQKLVILLDEMEILEDYQNDDGIAIAEMFCNRNKYPSFIFVHAGSYQWKERALSPGSLFTHLEPLYLQSIDTNDMINFLLKPLRTKDKKQFVAEMSGSKPLYVQYIGKAIYEADRKISIDELSKNESLCGQIKQNIFEERRLDSGSKQILAALAHHPNVTGSWIAKKLSLNEKEAKRKLKTLERFGTASKSLNKYQIVGKFIEIYGKESSDDPCHKDFGLPPKTIKERLIPIIRWAVMFVFLILALILYRYTHPSYVLKIFNFPELKVEIECPRSLESEENGELKVSVSNMCNKSINSLTLLFNSTDIRYNKDGRNTIELRNIDPNHTVHTKIHYHVHSGDSKNLKSDISISELKSLSSSFEINRRALPLKSYNPIFSILLALVGFIIPWKNWGMLPSIISKVILDKSKN